MRNIKIYHGGSARASSKGAFSAIQPPSPFLKKVSVSDPDTPDYLNNKIIDRSGIVKKIVTVSAYKTLEIYSDAFEEIISRGMFLGNLETRGLNFIDLGTMYAQTIIQCFTYCGDGIFIAGTNPNGKILRSTDYGATWTDLGTIVAGATGMPSAIYIGNGIVLMGTAANGHIIRSTDYGATWSDLGVIAAMKTIECFTYCGNGIIIAGSNEGLTAGKKGHVLRSTDYGATWSDLGTLNDEKRLKSVVYCGNGIVLIGTGTNGNIQKSTDYGATWTPKGKIFEAYTISEMAYCGGRIVLAGVIDNTGGSYNSRIYRSTDNGETWTDSGQIGAAQGITAIKYIGNGVLLSADGASEIYRSIDYGLSWTNTFTADAGSAVTGGIGSGEKDVYLIGTGLTGKIWRGKIY